MRQALHQRFWLPLLLLVVGYHRQRDACNHCDNGLFFVNAAENCVPDRCIVGCNCVLETDTDASDNATCAVDYGKWGWSPPDDAEAKVWKNMDQEVRPLLFFLVAIAVYFLSISHFILLLRNIV